MNSVNSAPSLVPSVVAFMDILGTKEANGSRDLLNVVVEAVDFTRKESLGGALLSSSVSWFSDCLVLSAEDPSPDTIREVLWDIAYLQYRIAKSGWYLRGGIAIGDHYHQNEFDYGPALIEAVGLEAKAKNPMVVLSEAAVELHLRGSVDRLAVCTDEGLGLSFVNWIRSIALANMSAGGTWAMQAESFRMRIEHQLRESRGKPWFSKYQWLARQWNEVAADEAPNLCIDRLDIDPPATQLP